MTKIDFENLKSKNFETFRFFCKFEILLGILLREMLQAARENKGWSSDFYYFSAGEYY